jgi:PAS domain S-box-containing protein
VLKGFKTRVYHKDGSIIEILINARAVRDESGAAVYYEGFIQEITGPGQEP